jgi:ArsR family transcriptional regulator
VVKALAEPLRLAILDTLREGERCVHDIAVAVGAERSNVSRHLAVLAGVGIVSSRKQGLHVFYVLQTPCILNLFNCVRGVMEADLEVARQALCATQSQRSDRSASSSAATASVVVPATPERAE